VQIVTATTTQTATSPAGTWPDDGQWHQVVADLSADRLRIILDSTIVLDEDTALLPDGSTVELTTANTWDGTLDEVILIDRGLTNWELLSRSMDTPLPEPSAQVEYFITHATDTLPDPLIMLSRSDSDPYGLQRWETYPLGVEPEEHGYTGQEKEADLGLYHYGARYYSPEIGRFLQVDHMRQFANTYSYVGSQPTTKVDPSGNDAIFIVFHKYRISVNGMRLPGLGHAGILLIDNKSGLTKYYEYGRYDREQLGVVRTRRVPNVIIDKKTGRPTLESLNKTLDSISKQAGQGGPLLGIYVNSDFKESLEYAENKRKENNDPSREPYSLGIFGSPNNCGSFAKECADAGGTILPEYYGTPIGYFGVASANAPGVHTVVSYDPEKSETTVRRGVFQFLKDLFSGERSFEDNEN
jgi:RHS repeat-associated protein